MVLGEASADPRAVVTPSWTREEHREDPEAVQRPEELPQRGSHEWAGLARTQARPGWSARAGWRSFGRSFGLVPTGRGSRPANHEPGCRGHCRRRHARPCLESLPILQPCLVRDHPGRPAAHPTAVGWDEASELRARSAGVRLPRPGRSESSFRTDQYVWSCATGTDRGRSDWRT